MTVHHQVRCVLVFPCVRYLLSLPIIYNKGHSPPHNLISIIIIIAGPSNADKVESGARVDTLMGENGTVKPDSVRYLRPKVL